MRLSILSQAVVDVLPAPKFRHQPSVTREVKHKYTNVKKIAAVGITLMANPKSYGVVCCEGGTKTSLM